MAAPIENTHQLKATLETLHILDQQVRHATERLPPTLDAALHSPDALPDHELQVAARSVVDAMDKLQLRLVPSVLLLADGFFGTLLCGGRTGLTGR
jgi:hypothetical protein